MSNEQLRLDTRRDADDQGKTRSATEVASLKQAVREQLRYMRATQSESPCGGWLQI
jgi:hypothetical protein